MYYSENKMIKLYQDSLHIEVNPGSRELALYDEKIRQNILSLH